MGSADTTDRDGLLPPLKMETPDSSLSESERSLLETLLADTSVRARRRARIILDWSGGKEPGTIALDLGTRPVRVRIITSAFAEKRLDIFTPAARRRAGVSSAPEESPQATASPELQTLTPPEEPAPRKRALEPASSMREAAQIIIAHQFSKLKNVEPQVRASGDVEAVHDMRVACRRMNSALRLFRAYLPPKRGKKLRGMMEELRDLLGAARNLDVLLQDLNEFLASATDQDKAQLDKVAAGWRAERAADQNKLVQLLDSDAYQKWEKRMDAFTEEGDGDDSPQVSHVVPALVWKQYGAVREAGAHLGEASLEELHALRIDIKRLRYTLEFFADVFGEKPGALIESLVALQDRLGTIQDAVVAGGALTDFIAAQAKEAERAGGTTPGFQGLAAYHAHLHARIETLRGGLAKEWESIAGPAFRQGLAQVTARL